MKAIEACVKLDNDKDHHANTNANSQARDVHNGVIAVTGQTSECSFEIVFKHKKAVCSFFPPKQYRYLISMSTNHLLNTFSRKVYDSGTVMSVFVSQIVMLKS